MTDPPAELRDRVNVWIVEDSADYRATIEDLLEPEDDLDCSGAFPSGEELFEQLNDRFAPEVVLMDIGLPGMTGVEVVSRIKKMSPETNVIMLTVHEDNDRIFQSICAGASGYLSKSEASPEEILEAIREVARGGAAMSSHIARRVLNIFAQLHAPRWDYELTNKEKDVLRELVKGKTKAKIAEDMFLSVHTIDTHLRNIYRKLHVNSGLGAIAKALKENLVKGVE